VVAGDRAAASFTRAGEHRAHKYLACLLVFCLAARFSLMLAGVES